MDLVYKTSYFALGTPRTTYRAQYSFPCLERSVVPAGPLDAMSKDSVTETVAVDQVRLARSHIPGGIVDKITRSTDLQTVDERVPFIRSLAVPDDIPASVSVTFTPRVEAMPVGLHRIARSF